VSEKDEKEYQGWVKLRVWKTKGLGKTANIYPNYRVRGEKVCVYLFVCLFVGWLVRCTAVIFMLVIKTVIFGFIFL